MALYLLKQGKNEFHFSFGTHWAPPKPAEALDAKKLDALVLEENLLPYPQASRIISQMRQAGKPVFYVENRSMSSLMDALTDAGLAALPVAAVSGLVHEFTSQENMTRRRFLNRLFWASAGAGIACLSDFLRVLPNLFSMPRGPRVYSREELASLARDFPGGLFVAKRNAVIAEGLAQLAKKYARIGVVAGTAHYNLPRYLEEPSRRAGELGKHAPEIRRLFQL